MIMLQAVITGLLWFSAIGCGLLAGVYFAFSAFIMTALGRIGQAAGIMAMNAIDAVIVQSLFGARGRGLSSALPDLTTN
jgi:uncharacterized membrane protein